MAAAWPVIVNRLVAHLPTLSGWTAEGDRPAVAVYDSEPLTGDAPSEYVTVGYADGEDFGGSYEQTRNGEGYYSGGLQETGTIRSTLVCWTGDDDIPGMRARAFELVDAWEAWLSSDEALGVLGVSSISSLAVDVQPIQNDAGSEQRLTVTLSYLARS